MPAPNDNIANAQVLTGLSGSTPMETNDATNEPGEPVGQVTYPGIWFKTQPQSEVLRWTFDTLGSNYDSYVEVFKGATSSSLTFIGYDDDSAGSGMSRIKVTAQPGETLWVRVSDYNGGNSASTTKQLNWSASPPPPAPTNDNVANRIVVTGTTFEYNTSGTTFEMDEEDRNYYTDAGSVWFEWTTPVGSSKTIFVIDDVTGAGASSTLLLYGPITPGMTMSDIMDWNINQTTIYNDGTTSRQFTSVTTEGAKYYLAVQGPAQTGRVRMFPLYHGEWITPPAQGSGMTASAKIWLRYTRHTNPANMTSYDQYLGHRESPASGPTSGGEAQPWYRSEYSSRYDPNNTSGSNGEWRQLTSVCVWVWKPEFFPDHFPQFADRPEGWIDYEFERTPKTLSERLVPNQQLTLSGVIVVVESTESEAGNMHLTRATPNSYYFHPNGQIYEPWNQSTLEDDEHGSGGPSPNLFNELGSTLLIAPKPGQNENPVYTTFVDMPIGGFDPQGGVAIGMRPSDTSRPHPFPSNPYTLNDRSYARLQTVVGDTGISARPGNINFQYYPDRFRYLFYEPQNDCGPWIQGPDYEQNCTGYIKYGHGATSGQQRHISEWPQHVIDCYNGVSRTNVGVANNEISAFFDGEIYAAATYKLPVPPGNTNQLPNMGVAHAGWTINRLIWTAQQLPTPPDEPLYYDHYDYESTDPVTIGYVIDLGLEVNSINPPNLTEGGTVRRVAKGDYAFPPTGLIPFGEVGGELLLSRESEGLSRQIFYLEPQGTTLADRYVMLETAIKTVTDRRIFNPQEWGEANSITYTAKAILRPPRHRWCGVPPSEDGYWPAHPQVASWDTPSVPFALDHSTTPQATKNFIPSYPVNDVYSTTYPSNNGAITPARIV